MKIVSNCSTTIEETVFCDVIPNYHCYEINEPGTNVRFMIFYVSILTTVIQFKGTKCCCDIDLCNDNDYEIGIRDNSESTSSDGFTPLGSLGESKPKVDIKLIKTDSNDNGFVANSTDKR